MKTSWPIEYTEFRRRKDGKGNRVKEKIDQELWDKESKDYGRQPPELEQGDTNCYQTACKMATI